MRPWPEILESKTFGALCLAGITLALIEGGTHHWYFLALPLLAVVGYWLVIRKPG